MRVKIEEGLQEQFVEENNLESFYEINLVGLPLQKLYIFMKEALIFTFRMTVLMAWFLTWVYLAIFLEKR